MSAHVAPDSGICESRTSLSTAAPPGIEPCAIEPCAVEPSPIEPVAIEPTAIDPCAIEPTAIEPVAMEPCAIEPCAIEPWAVEPAGAEFGSWVREASRDDGIDENGACLIPAGTVDSSEVIVTELTAVFVTLTGPVWTARSAPSAPAPTRK